MPKPESMTESQNSDVLQPIEKEILKSIAIILADMDSLHADTWRLILIFLNFLAANNKVRLHQSYHFIQANIKILALQFADILFKPEDSITSNDMVMWRHFTDLLSFMIIHHEEIYYMKIYLKSGFCEPTETVATSSLA